MTTTSATIEQEIQAKGLTAPRITPADIEANIASEFYFTGEDGVVGHHVKMTKGSVVHSGEMHSLAVLTLCVLVLRNGFTVVGKSACVSPENFKPELGRQIARADAVEQMWPLMGYALKERLRAEDAEARIANALA